MDKVAVLELEKARLLAQNAELKLQLMEANKKAEELA